MKLHPEFDPRRVCISNAMSKGEAEHVAGVLMSSISAIGILYEADTFGKNTWAVYATRNGKDNRNV
jgi:hypothetical protein